MCWKSKVVKITNVREKISDHMGMFKLVNEILIAIEAGWAVAQLRAGLLQWR